MENKIITKPKNKLKLTKQRFYLLGAVVFAVTALLLELLAAVVLYRIPLHQLKPAELQALQSQAQTTVVLLGFITLSVFLLFIGGATHKNVLNHP